MIQLTYYPTKTFRMTSPYGPRYRNGIWEWHRGIDLGPVTPNVGETLYATTDGVISRARPLEPSYGNYLAISHGDWCEHYAHFEKFYVKTGDKIKAGQALGVMGTTGDSTGIHLHYEIRNCPYGLYYNSADKSQDGRTYKNIPKYIVDPEPYVRAAKAPPEDCATLVKLRCGLPDAVVTHFNKYPYAADLWRKLWAVIEKKRFREADIDNPNADLATAVARECNLSGTTIAYIWRYADKQTVYKQIWQPLWWNMQ